MKKIKRIIRRLNRFVTKKYPDYDIRIAGLEVEEGYDVVTILYDDCNLTLQILNIEEDVVGVNDTFLLINTRSKNHLKGLFRDFFRAVDETKAEELHTGSPQADPT